MSITRIDRALGRLYRDRDAARLSTGLEQSTRPSYDMLAEIEGQIDRLQDIRAMIEAEARERRAGRVRGFLAWHQSQARQAVPALA